jgi:hypothetical protein
MSLPETVARSTSPRGEIHLRRRTDGALELRVNGVFVMDDQETRSEELLATAALLGLGYTVRALLADKRTRQVLVAEIEPDLVQWMQDGLLPSVLDSPRVEVVVGDVRDVLRDQPDGSLDGILLDVDNGPDFLVYDGNAAIYRPDFLADCRRKLRAGGTLTVWSSADSASLADAVRDTFGDCVVRPVPVVLQGRAETYYVYRAGS